LAALHEKVPVRLHTFHGHVFHSYFSPLKTRMFIEIERWLAKKSQAIVAISATQKRELAEDFRIAPADKIHIVHNGFDLSRFTGDQDRLRQTFRAQYRLAPDEVAIGIIGRLVPVKNHSLFLQSISLLAGRCSIPVRAFIIGDGEDREKVEQQVRELNLPFHVGETPPPDGPGPVKVCFTSWIRDIERATAGLDLIVLTSLNEGTPVSLIEAQAAARAVVSTRVGGVADILPPELLPYLSPSGDAESLANHLQTLVSDPVLRESAGKAGRNFVMDRFSYQALCKNMGNLYQKLLNDVGKKI
jgi:glycosyltransferase involved in cell wall biosynthesis